MHLRRLTEGDHEAALHLISLDPIRGSLIQSLITRLGLAGGLEFHGLFEQRGDAVGGVETLSGIITMGSDGRSTMLRGGTEWAPLIAGYVRQRVSEGLELAFIDAPQECAGALALEMPPRETEELEIWVHRPDEACLEEAITMPGPVPYGHPLVVRPVEMADAPDLGELYATTEMMAGADVELILDNWRSGIVGCLDGRIVATAFALVTDRDLARVAGVVTHPDYRGRGFASRVVGALTEQLVRAGMTPFLYVSTGNEAAVHLYAGLQYFHYASVIKLRYGRRLY